MRRRWHRQGQKQIKRPFQGTPNYVIITLLQHKFLAEFHDSGINFCISTMNGMIKLKQFSAHILKYIFLMSSNYFHCLFNYFFVY